MREKVEEAASDIKKRFKDKFSIDFYIMVFISFFLFFSFLFNRHTLGLILSLLLISFSVAFHYLDDDLSLKGKI